MVELLSVKNLNPLLKAIELLWSDLKQFVPPIISILVRRFMN